MIKADKLVTNIKITTWLFVVFIIGFFLFLTGATRPVLNFNNETNSVMYPEQCFRPPNELTQEYVDLCSIPQDYVKTDHVIIIGIAVLGLIGTLVGDKGKTTEMADIEEAREIVNKYLKTHEKIVTDTGEVITIGKYHISPNFLLPEERVGKETIPLRYVLDVTIIDLEEMEFYVRAYVHPFKRYLKGFVSADKPLDEKDRCSKCGTEHDIGYKDTEDYKKFKEMKDEMSGQ